MNIQQAKEEIKNAMTAYFTKNEFGGYEIPIERQRPVCLMGPPGIGKTAIMEQVAQELGVGLVNYSMTHHTRQSALGLPFIVRKNYGGKEYSVSEYTMSEILASVYDLMEQTGVREGILFLDEINCVSETLAPAMLQFLQYKVFGRHQVPPGWIVVTAGNPPEYNNSVREFDVVTWDRLKRIDIEPDLEAWKRYAQQKSVHPAILTYLDMRKQNFYRIEMTTGGRRFVTARGWSDLSEMLRLYEKRDLPVTERLVGQYLQDPAVARDFAVYYDLFTKYRADYQVGRILAGTEEQAIRDRAAAAGFDERLSLLGLLTDAITERIEAVVRQEQTAMELQKALQDAKPRILADGDASAILEQKARELLDALEKGKASSTLDALSQQGLKGAAAALEQERELVDGTDPAQDYETLRADFTRRAQELRTAAENTVRELDNLYRFCEEVFQGGQELTILSTELTANDHAVRFVSHYGSEAYFAHSRELLFFERRNEILRELETLDL